MYFLQSKLWHCSVLSRILPDVAFPHPCVLVCLKDRKFLWKYWINQLNIWWKLKWEINKQNMKSSKVEALFPIYIFSCMRKMCQRSYSITVVHTYIESSAIIHSYISDCSIGRLPNVEEAPLEIDNNCVAAQFHSSLLISR